MGPRTRYWDGYRWRQVTRIRSETVRTCWGQYSGQVEGWFRAKYLRGPELEHLLERGLARCLHTVTALAAPEGVCLALNAPIGSSSVRRGVGLEEAMAAIRSMRSMVEVHSL